MKRVVFITLGLLAITVLVAWLALRGETWTFSFTQQQIEEKLAERFPISKRHLLVFRVHYENPRVRLTDGSSDVQVGLDARVDGTLNGKELKGSADLVTKIDYDAENGTFVLHDAELVGLEITGLKREVMDDAMEFANKLAAERVSGVPIYKLRPKDVKTAVARLVLKSVSVRDGVLHVEVGV